MAASSVCNWEFQKKLGSGGFGEVVLWKNRITRQNIATKQIKDVSSMSADQQIKLSERWEKEYKWTREFQNVDCIVAGIKLEETDPKFVEHLNRNHKCKLPVIILEYCDGGDVRKRLQLPENANGLRELEIRDIMHSMGKAVHFLHSELKVCHRDLKPDNIVIQHKANGKKMYKLTDFGLARQSPNMTMLQSVVGTRHYFAPEVISTGKYNNSVDYWSLGIIAYELSTGTLPFIPHQTPRIIIDNLLSKEHQYIAITEDVVTGEFQYQTKLPLEHNLSQCWAEKLEEWLPLALETKYQKRGELVAASLPDEVQSGLPVVLKSLFELCQIKVLTIFVVNCYKRLAYIITPDMTLDQLSELICESIQDTKICESIGDTKICESIQHTKIPKEKIRYILPIGHPHKNLSLETRPSDLYVEEWLDNSEGVKHSPVMLYVFIDIIEESFKSPDPIISNSMKVFINLDYSTKKSWAIQQFRSLVHHALTREQECIKLFLFGLKEYAIFLEDKYVQFDQSLDSLNEEKLKTYGAYNLLEKCIKTLPQNPRWLSLEKEYTQLADVAKKTKRHYETGLRDSKKNVLEAQRLSKEWIEKDVFNVKHLRQKDNLDYEDLNNRMFKMADKREAFLNDPSIKNLNSDLLKMFPRYEKLFKTVPNCLNKLEDYHKKLLAYLMDVLKPQSELQLSDSMQRLSVDIHDNLDTNTLIMTSKKIDALMCEYMENDQR